MKSLGKDSELVLHNKLKLARTEQNLTQDDLAKMSGVTRQTIGAIESGKFNPTAKLALIFCIILDKKFEELFYFDL
jgi:putative transcriptional regulator